MSFREHRSLKVAEYDEVRRRIVLLDHTIALLVISSVLLATTVVALAVSLSVQPAEQVVPALVLASLSLVVCAIISRGKARRVRNIVHDFERGRVTVFRGVPTGITKVQWRKAGATGAADDVRDVSVLPKSRQIVSADDAILRWSLAAAEIDDSDAVRDPIPEDSSRGIGRPLSSAEIGEVRRIFSRRVWLFLPLVLTLVATVAVAIHVALTPDPEVLVWEVTTALAAIVLTGFLAVANWSLAARLWRDARHARVMLLADAGLAESIDGSSPYCGMNVEVLPLSERVWTIEGHPAGCRVARTRFPSRAR